MSRSGSRQSGCVSPTPGRGMIRPWPWMSTRSSWRPAASRRRWRRSARGAPRPRQVRLPPGRPTSRRRREGALLDRVDPSIPVRDQWQGPGHQRGTLAISLDGPLALDRLDRVSVTYKTTDQTAHGARYRAARARKDQALRLERVQAEPECGERRSVRAHVAFPDGLAVGEKLMCALEKTSAPSWVTTPSEQWRADESTNEPLRLLVTCERRGIHE